jgi:polysaccharide export outer membrane protein
MLFLLPLFFSCVNTRKATNFNNLADSTIEYKTENLEPVIQKNDILSISVSSVNAEATVPFNLYAKTTSQGSVNAGTASQSNGFLVDQDGSLQFPMLGRIKAAGLTKKQLKSIITRELIQRNLLFDPVVDIRYLNYKVTVLGEVIHPSVFNVPSEKITLLEALGLAGDLTPYARRDNILILHEVEEGKRVAKRINLNDNELLTSPYYYLKSNDVVYVAANEAKVASTSTTKQWLPVFISSLSFIAIVVDRLTR